SQRLLFVLHSVLTNAPPPAAVKSLLLRLSGLTGETGKQLRLGERGRVQRQMEEAVRQLKARYGFSPVYRCIDVEPWSVIPEERQILVESDVCRRQSRWKWQKTTPGNRKVCGWKAAGSASTLSAAPGASTSTG